MFAKSLYFLFALQCFADFHARTKYELRWSMHIFGKECSDQVLLNRVDRAFSFKDGKECSFRLDIPYIWLKCRETVFIEVDEDGVVVEGKPASLKVRERGLSDLMGKLFFAFPFEGFFFGLGSEWMFPTAQSLNIGTGKYRMKPILGFTREFERAAVTFFVKYEFSYAGDKSRPSIQIFYIDPSLAILLNPHSTLSFSSEMQLDCIQNEWFIPLGVSLSQGIQKHLTASLEYKIGILREFDVFRHQLEIGLNLLF